MKRISKRKGTGKRPPVDERPIGFEHFDEMSRRDSQMLAEAIERHRN